MLQVLGRLHPLLVHFPIALLLVALGTEGWRLVMRRSVSGGSEPVGLGAAGYTCLQLGTAGAVLAALTGWLFAEQDPPGMPELVLRHRWSGVGAATSACVTLLSARRWRTSANPALARPTRAGLALTGLLIGFSAHLGGAMVYGEGFVLEPLRAPPAAGPAHEGLSSSVALEGGPAADPGSAVLPHEALEPDLFGEVRALFARRCSECHGDRKRAKGNLRLTDMAAVFARPPDEAVIVPGDPAASALYQRITLPADDLDVMPPDEAPLPAEEIELVRRWIAAGAPWSEPVEAPPASAPLAPTPSEAAASGTDEAPQGTR